APFQGVSWNTKVSLPPLPVSTSPPRPTLKVSLHAVPVVWSPLLSEVKVWPVTLDEDGVEVEVAVEVEVDVAPLLPAVLDDAPSVITPPDTDRLDAATWSRSVTSQLPPVPTGRPSRSTHTCVPPTPSATSF